MNPNDLGLHALLNTSSGWIEAQMLELDIAVGGATQDDIIREFEHAIIVLYEAAKKLNLTPFANIKPAPERFQRKLPSCKADGASGYINLPEDVAYALAIALRANRPIREIPVFEWKPLAA